MIDPRYLRELIEATRQVVRVGLALSIFKPKYPKVSTLLEFKSLTTVKSTMQPIEAIESPLQSSISTKSTIQPIEAMLNTNTSTIGVKSSVSIEVS